MQLAVNPANAMNVAVARSVVESGSGQIIVSTSSDGGATWTSPVDLTMLDVPGGGSFDGNDPGVAYDPSGDLFVSFDAPPDLMICELKSAPTSTWHNLTLEGGAPQLYNQTGAGFDKDSIAIGWDPTNQTQALYVTSNFMPRNLTLVGYDITSSGDLTNCAETTSGFLDMDWGPPVISASGTLYMANNGVSVKVERLPGGLWNGATFDTNLGVWDGATFDSTVTVATDPQGGLYETPVPAAPQRGIFASPTLSLDSAGMLWLADLEKNPGFVGTPTSLQAKTQIYVQSCASPASSLQSWSSAMAIDPSTSVTQFHPVISADPSAQGAVAVEFYTTDGDPNLQAVKTRLAVTTNSGATWVHTDLSSTTSNMNLYDSVKSPQPGPLNFDYAEYNGVAMYNGVIHGAWSAANTAGDPSTWNESACTATVAVTTSLGEIVTLIGPTTGTLVRDPSNNYLLAQTNGQTIFAGWLANISEVASAFNTTITLTSDLNDSALMFDDYGTLLIDTTEHLGWLQIEQNAQNNASVILPGNTAADTIVLYVTRLTMISPANCKLDLGDNALAIDYGAIGGSSPDATIRAELITGRNSANTGWNGLDGITSSVADGSTYTLGYVDRAITSTHEQEEVIMYTLGGDANLSENVNTSDFNLMAANYGASGSGIGWYQGDFNYDGTVNATDDNILTGKFGQRLPAGSGAPPT